MTAEASAKSSACQHGRARLIGIWITAIPRALSPERRMFKVVCLLKRRSDLSVEQFQHYYEHHHRLLGEKWMPTLIRYVRRYLRPMTNPVRQEKVELPYDVLTEFWFETREDCEAAMTALSDPVAAREIADDGVKLFDRSNICLCMVEEYDSTLTKASNAARPPS
jgi:hypothetical protein